MGNYKESLLVLRKGYRPYKRITDKTKENYKDIIVALRKKGHTISCIAIRLEKHHSTISHHLKIEKQKKVRKRAKPKKIYIPQFGSSHPYADILNRPINQGKTYEEYLKNEDERKHPRKTFKGIEI